MSFSVRRATDIPLRDPALPSLTTHSPATTARDQRNGCYSESTRGEKCRIRCNKWANRNGTCLFGARYGHVRPLRYECALGDAVRPVCQPQTLMTSCGSPPSMRSIESRSQRWNGKRNKEEHKARREVAIRTPLESAWTMQSLLEGCKSVSEAAASPPPLSILRMPREDTRREGGDPDTAVKEANGVAISSARNPAHRTIGIPHASLCKISSAEHCVMNLFVDHFIIRIIKQRHRLSD